MSLGEFLALRVTVAASNPDSPETNGDRRQHTDGKGINDPDSQSAAAAPTGGVRSEFRKLLCRTSFSL